jgi:transcriptional regulator with XRE-family HTH domain
MGIKTGAGGHVSSGVPSLDDLLGGGLVLGDNVVWVADQAAASDAFCAPFLAVDDGARRRVVRLGARRTPVPSGVEVVDLSTATRAHDLEAVERAIVDEGASEGDRLVVDGLDDVVLRWGAPAAERLYQRACPRLFDLGVVAYWVGSREVLSASVVEAVSKVAQCAFDLRGDRLRVGKAEGRPAKLQGSLVDVRTVDGAPVVSGEHAVGRVGEGLRRIRRQRNLTQGQVASLAGVTPGAVSQAETGRRGLSLDTLVPLCEALGIGLDDLLGTAGPHDHVLVRRDRHPTGAGTAPLFDDPATGLRAYTVRLAPDEDAAPPFAHKGVELVVVVDGLVLVDLGETTPVLRTGDALMVTRVPIRRWRNLGPEPVELLWLVSG